MSQTITNSAFPLSWPAGRKRTEPHRRGVSNFGTRSFAVARDQLLAEVKRLGGVKQIVLSTNVELRGDGLPYANRRAPEDPGIALYFVDRKGRQLCFACDRWKHIEDNMRAVEKTIEALRGVERWGSGDMMDAAFTGFAALPAASTGPTWWEKLVVTRNAPLEQVESNYRYLKMKHHPDRNSGDDAEYKRVEQAWADFKRERGLT